MRVSQEALAVDADLDRSYVGGIERGEHNLTVMNIVKIAAALQIKPSELLGSRVRHQMTQVVDSYRARFKLATTKGSTGRLGSVF